VRSSSYAASVGSLDGRRADDSVVERDPSVVQRAGTANESRYERLLALIPDWRSNVTYLQITRRAARKSGKGNMLAWSARSKRKPPAGYQGHIWRVSLDAGSAMSTVPTAAAAHWGALACGTGRVVTPLRDAETSSPRNIIAAPGCRRSRVLVLSRFAGAEAELARPRSWSIYEPEAVGDDSIATRTPMRSRAPLPSRRALQGDFRQRT